MLTRRQKQLLDFIRSYADARGLAPNFDEMRQALGLQSKSGVHALVQGLIERGYLRQQQGRARAIELLKPVQAIPASSITIPHYGRIAAGLPIEAIADSETLTLPAGWLGAGQYYALTVAGHSMVDAGIQDGDTALIAAQNTANTGAIIVALLGNLETTLKYYHPHGAEIELRPANAAFAPQIYASEQVQIQGVLRGLWRHYP